HRLRPAPHRHEPGRGAVELPGTATGTEGKLKTRLQAAKRAPEHRAGHEPKDRQMKLAPKIERAIREIQKLGGTAVPRIEELNLDGTKTRDSNLVVLKCFPPLQALNLFNTEVPDAGLAHLKPHSQLKRLAPA